MVGLVGCSDASSRLRVTPFVVGRIPPASVFEAAFAGCITASFSDRARWFYANGRRMASMTSAHRLFRQRICYDSQDEGFPDEVGRW